MLKNAFRLLILTFLTTSFLIGQEEKISQVTVDVVDDRLVIGYDFFKNYPYRGDIVERLYFGAMNYYDVSLKVYDGNKKLVEKNHKSKKSIVDGDIGFSIPSGNNKRIFWDVFSDDIELVGDNLIFTIEAKKLKKLNFANFIIPGLYQYKVQRKPTIFAKSFLFYSSLIAGIVFNNISSNEYEKYNNATNSADIENYYTNANVSLQWAYLCYTLSATITLENIYNIFKRSPLK